jgi:hypothetical protein
MTLRPTLTFAIMLVWLMPMPRSLAEVTFKDNGKWGTVKADSYNATLFKNGVFELDIKDSLKFRASFLHRWKHYQKFPQIKFLRANLKNEDNKIIEATYKYLWNGGTVEEHLRFDCRSISVSYSFMPWTEKDTRYFTCLLTMKMPEKEGMELVGMDHKGPNGALDALGKWKKMRSYFRMASVRNAGPYVVDFISEGKAWINIWKYPNMGVIKNAKKRMFDNTIYQKDEIYKVEYLVNISKSNGKTLKLSSINFNSEAP